jgi:hypothetical protein
MPHKTDALQGFGAKVHYGAHYAKRALRPVFSTRMRIHGTTPASRRMHQTLQRHLDGSSRGAA